MARIAIVLNASWNIYNFRLPLLRHLEAAGHEIIAIAPEDEYTSRIPYEFHPIRIKSRSLNPLNHLAVFLGFLKIFRRTRPDIALLYTIQPNTHGNLAARCSGVRTISNIAGLGNVFIDRRFATIVAKLLYKAALAHPDTVFFQNREDMELFRTLGLVSAERSRRIPGSGVDINRFSPQAAETRNEETFVFLLATRMLWEKGVAEFAEAARSIKRDYPNVMFRLIGPLGVDNPVALTEQDMRHLTEGGSVEYLGVSDRMEEVIGQADCVVLPSYREGLPKILLEAAAMAKPIITTRVPGCVDVVEHGSNGLLCEVRDAQDLEEKMLAILAMGKEGREQMGANGRNKICREFTQEIVSVHYENAVNSILDEQSGTEEISSFPLN